MTAMYITHVNQCTPNIPSVNLNNASLHLWLHPICNIPFELLRSFIWLHREIGTYKVTVATANSWSLHDIQTYSCYQLPWEKM